MGGRLQALSARLRGEAGEARARAYLEQQGLSHRHSNYRSRFGEIDLIMQEGNSVVFVEVRVRKNARFGGAMASVNRSKQQKLIKTALAYLQQHAPQAWSRFDVVAFDGDNEPQWIRGAFDAS